MPAAVVCGLGLLRCGSDAAEAMGFVFGVAAAAISCADAGVAAFSLPADPGAGLSGTAVQDDGGRTAKSFWVEGLAEVIGEAT